MSHTKSLNAVAVIICLALAAINVCADVVLDWNAIMQTTVNTTFPFTQGRSAAIVQLAVFEAVNAIVGGYRPYVGTVTAPPGASPEAAAIVAAHDTLAALYPAATTTLDAQEALSLLAIPDGQAKIDGIAVGKEAAIAMLTLRANDGSSAVVGYTPGNDPGDWQPTPPAYLPALSPGWGQVTTFGIKSGSQFRSAPPPPLNGGRYAHDYNEVMLKGDVNSTVRPQDRTDVALFYRASAVQVLNQVARLVSVAQGKTLAQNAHDLALLNMAICDGLISSMETKYFYNRWRPVTAIRFGDTDDNPKTELNATWLPLVTTPPFPSYPSAHASSSGAARRVLEHVYGRSGFAVDLTSPTAPGVVLHYTAWKQITDDIDDARIYGGIHFRSDQQAGAEQGAKVGIYIISHDLRPMKDDE
jgi:hypothetical protein